MRNDAMTLREHKRLSVVIPALCRSRADFRDRVMIYDISVGGCMIESPALIVGGGDLVVIRPEGLEGLAGRVQWTDRHRAGIRFERPLYEPVVEHLHRQFATYLASEECSAGAVLRLAAA